VSDEGRWERLRAALPSRRGWLELFATPTCWLLMLSLLVTIYGKASVLSGVGAVSMWPVVLVRVTAFDIAAFMGIATLFAAGEQRGGWIRFVTAPVAIVVTIFALINAWYLLETGEQLSWSAVALGIDRFSDLLSIAGEIASRVVTIAMVVVGAAILVPTLVTRRLQLRSWAVRSRERVRAAAILAGVGALVALMPAPAALPAQRVTGNAAVTTYVQWITDADPVTKEHVPAEFAGYDPAYLTSLSAIQGLASSTRKPNVLVVVLESTRWDHTSLAPPSERRGRQTPNLEALAAQGVTARRARAVVPHTTKSLFTMLCGRYPAMQRGIVEYSRQFHAQCLADILRRAGYRTGFFQSSWGVFEERPRLVGNMGYEHFEAWEDIQGERLGYLASDDLSLPGAVARWLDAGESAEQPFFVTVLTSATHHPYRLPASVARLAAESGSKTDTPQQRYSLLVEAADRMLGRLVNELERRGLRDQTLIVVAGDHGEGFGDKGVKQHDNNFFEEGLHVPLVFAGPSVARGQTIGPNVFLGDVTPTILARLGLALAPEVADTLIGTDILASELAERELPFACWYDDTCRGFVQGQHKVVHLIAAKTTFMFTLDGDPDETTARPILAEARDRLASLGAALRRFRTVDPWPLQLGPLDFAGWTCKINTWCSHPRMVKGPW
jgi:arylsulfatase A-like enzyme